MKDEITYVEKIKKAKKEKLDELLSTIDKYKFFSELNWRTKEAKTLIDEIQYLTNVIVMLKELEEKQNAK